MTLREADAKQVSGSRRIRLLDTIRGVMAIYMICYHTLFDLGFMFGRETAYRIFSAVSFSPMIIGTTFIFIAGLTVRFSRNPALHGAKLMLIAYAITVATGFVFPGSAIVFGVLHLISTCMLIYAVIGKVLERLHWLPGVIAGLVLYVCTYWTRFGFFGIKGLFEIPVPREMTLFSRLYPLGFLDSSFSSADYYPLLPWLFLFICGCFIGRFLERDDLPEPLYRDYCPPLTFIGRHSLLIYVVHQPVIYGICLLLN